MNRGRKIYVNDVSMLLPTAREPPESCARKFGVPIEMFYVPEVHCYLDNASNAKFEKRRSKIDKFSSLALTATHPLISAALKVCSVDKVGVFVGNMLGGWGFAERELRNLYEHGPDRVSPHQSTAWFPAAAQGEITIAHSLLGYSKTLSGGLFCGLEALSVAADALLLGRIQVGIVGVSEALVSQIAVQGVRDIGVQSIGESACFYLVSRDPLSESAVSLQIVLSRDAELAGRYTCETETDVRRACDYKPFFLSAQSLIDIADTIRRSSHGLSTTLGFRSFHRFCNVTISS